MKHHDAIPNLGNGTWINGPITKFFAKLKAVSGLEFGCSK